MHVAFPAEADILLIMEIAPVVMNATLVPDS
jgi:hypothetical protein